GRRLTGTHAANSALAATAYTCYDKVGQVLRTIQGWTSDLTQPSPDAHAIHGQWLFNPTTHGAANDLNRITSYTLDRQGRTVAITDPVGSTTMTAYRKD